MGILANNPSPPPFTVEAATYLQRWNFVELAIGGFLFFSYTVDASWGSRTVGWSPKKPSSLELTFLQTTLKSNHIDETTLIKSGWRLDKTIRLYSWTLVTLETLWLTFPVGPGKGLKRSCMRPPLHLQPTTWWDSGEKKSSYKFFFFFVGRVFLNLDCTGFHQTIFSPSSIEPIPKNWLLSSKHPLSPWSP